jgi:hypothetical protein
MNELEKLVEEKAKALVNGEKKESAPKPVEPSPLDIQPEKSYDQKAKEIVGALATQEAIKDEELKRGITDRKKSALLNSADADMKREEAENKKADIQLQEANYGVHSGVAAYAGIKKPLPSKMQAILFTILSVIQTIFLIAIGVPISIINICADGIDSVVKKLGTLTKSAMWIVLVLIALGVIWAAIYVVKFFLLKFGIIA